MEGAWFSSLGFYSSLVKEGKMFGGRKDLRMMVVKGWKKGPRTSVQCHPWVR